MKTYQADMDRQTEKQQRKQNRAARPIIICMIILFVLGVAPLIVKLFSKSP